MTNRKKGTWFFVLMFVFSLGFLSAQEENIDEGDGSSPSIESDWSAFDVPSYQLGDQMIGLGFGLIFPTLFVGNDGNLENKVNMGGVLYFSYDFFFHPNMAAGIEANFSFSSTIRENMLFQVPFGLRFTYQFAFHPIEIPISVTVGAAPHQYQDDNYFGLFVKPSLGVFWRMNADWSFGLNGTWWWMPEWTSNPAETVYGNFATLTLSARHHF